MTLCWSGLVCTTLRRTWLTPDLMHIERRYLDHGKVGTVGSRSLCQCVEGITASETTNAILSPTMHKASEWAVYWRCWLRILYSVDDGVWRIGALILTGGNRSTGRETCHTNGTWTGLIPNPGLRNARPATDSLSYGKGSKKKLSSSTCHW